MIKVLRGTPKHLSRGGELSGFTYLMLTLTFTCNYRCRKCFNLVEGAPAAIPDPIDTATILSRIEEARDSGGKVVVIAGEGEPTLNTNIRQIVTRIAELGMIPIVYSNGSTLTPPVAAFYRDHNACLVIAIDSLKPDVYTRLTRTGERMLPVVLGNLANLRRIFADTVEEQDGLRIVRLALNMTVCSPNMNEIQDLKALAGDDIYFVCNPLARHGNAVGNWDELIASESEFVEQQRLVAAHSESGGPLTLNELGLCAYSLNGIGIGPGGEFMTCAYTTKTNRLLGTIHDQTLREAYERKNLLERAHYENYGRVPCLVRADSFEAYLRRLRTTSP